MYLLLKKTIVYPSDVKSNSKLSAVEASLNTDDISTQQKHINTISLASQWGMGAGSPSLRCTRRRRSLVAIFLSEDFTPSSRTAKERRGKKRKLGVGFTVTCQTRRPRRGLQARDRTGSAATFRGNDEEAATRSRRIAQRSTRLSFLELASRDDPRRKSDDAWTKMTETCTAPREDDSRREQANKRERERERGGERGGERKREQVARDRGRQGSRRAHARLTFVEREVSVESIPCDGAIGRVVCDT